MSQDTCSIEGCPAPALARGWCNAHYRRWRRHGDPLGGGAPQPVGLTPAERFWAKVNKDGPIPQHRPDLGPCWIWTGATCRGYGQLTVLQRKAYAHRVAYELLVGAIPASLEIDHLCRVPPCVNPAHLEAVTSRENQRRGFGAAGRNARKTRCPRGHGYTPENTYHDKRGRRRCRTCALAANRARH